jgi:hypothetical protein
LFINREALLMKLLLGLLEKGLLLKISMHFRNK